MKKTLIVVDMQNDFIDKALGTPEAVQIVPNVVDKINAKNAGDSILVTLDTHGKNYLNTLEGKKLPVMHCIKHTGGWQLNADVKNALQEAEERGVFVKYFEKPTFGSKELAAWYVTPDEELEICGLCSDICVLSNAILLRAAHPNTTITVDPKATAGVTPATKDAALTALKMCQIDVL